MHRATPGITRKKLTRDPLGTEAELTAGPDDFNPYETASKRRQPTQGADPFTFDDVAPREPPEVVGQPTLPEPRFDPPRLDF